jgi:hypothetical protein
VTLWQRVFVAVLLLSALGGLFVHEDATSDARTPYPAPHELAADYDSYVGERILVFGEVLDRDGETVTLEAESEGVTIELRVTGVRATVAPGGVLQVYGDLGPDRTMTAERVVVVNDSGGAEWYKYVVSAVGALGFLIAFGRYWRIDTETWTLEARDG